MKILIIRHGDPDYVNDCLTERGKLEAQSLAKYLKNEKIDHYYMSPLGRAMETASYTLKEKGRTAEICPWLQEFNAPIIGDDGKEKITWDWLPEKWTCEEKYFSKDLWHTTDTMTNGRVIKEAERVWNGLDEVLERHGYKRNGAYYKAEKANNDTIALFCHFGVECVILSHLLNVSPMVLWHGTCALPTSVTTLYTEERRKGIAYFRMTSFGSTAHLEMDKIKPSFSGRFCEMYDNENERHD